MSAEHHRHHPSLNVYGTACEIIWGSHDNRQARQGLLWMLEQMEEFNVGSLHLLLVKKAAKAVFKKLSRRRAERQPRARCLDSLATDSTQRSLSKDLSRSEGTKPARFLNWLLEISDSQSGRTG